MNRNAPILVLGKQGDFSLYTCEILKAEGFNAFDACILPKCDISKIELDKYDIVIVGTSISGEELTENIISYVRDGGNLIAFRPDKRLASLLGMGDVAGVLTDAYIQIDPSSGIGKGLIGEVLQFHGTADLYRLDGAVHIAGLMHNVNTACGYPAAVLCGYGKGKAVVFTYNLPLSILLTRQGNPVNAGVECDGIHGLRAMDLFTDGWVDTSRSHINQADEQMRLLTHCIGYFSQTRKPLPRLWYFPNKLESIAILTNDGEDSSEADFVPQFDTIESQGASMSLYLKEQELVTKEKVQEWVKRGHEISGHPDDTYEAENPTWESKCGVYSAMVGIINDKLGLPVLTNVNHWFVWCGKDEKGEKDFTSEVKLEEKYGIKMDLNYAHYDNGSNQGHFLGSPGNFTGSGLPMRFADMQGNVIGVYQVLTNVYDQQYMENKDPEGFFDCFRIIADRSLEQEVYTVIGIKSHNDEWYFSKEPVMKMLEYAKTRGIPVWTAQRLLRFLQMKDGVYFENIEWTGECLSFVAKKTVHGEGLTLMIPFLHDDKSAVELLVDELSVPLDVRQVKGRKYLFTVLENLEDCKVDVKYE